VYSINPDTLECTQIFDALPAMNTNGTCGDFCHWPSDGIDFDERDKLLWISPDASTIIYQFDLTGNLIRTIGNQTDPIVTSDKCGVNWSSGIATGEGDILYSASGPCDWIFSWDKNTGARLSSFPIPAQRNEAAACDNVTFADDPFDAVWVKDLDGHLRAFVVPEGTCEIVPSPSNYTASTLSSVTGIQTAPVSNPSDAVSINGVHSRVSGLIEYTGILVAAIVSLPEGMI